MVPHHLITSHRVAGAAGSDHEARHFTIINTLKLDARAELDALERGLLAPAASIAPKYFYDALGSTLYNAIVLTPEYYPTRTEAAIFAQYRDEIAAAIGHGKQFVDLGSGDSVKAEKWFPSLRPSRYVAVDIAATALTEALGRLAGNADAPQLAGLVTDFSRVLDVTAVLAPEPTLFFYPGSSIGNFLPDQALWFLQQIRAHCHGHGCGLLIGVDGKKERDRLDTAYDDALGITAAFNRNALRHVNALLGTDFDVKEWLHRGFYNPALGRIEMHLEARHDLSVMLRGHRRHFSQGERIHTENSYKFTPDEFRALLDEAGFGNTRLWQDARGDFSVFYATT